MDSRNLLWLYRSVMTRHTDLAYHLTLTYARHPPVWRVRTEGGLLFCYLLLLCLAFALKSIFRIG